MKFLFSLAFHWAFHFVISFAILLTFAMGNAAEVLIERQTNKGSQGSSAARGTLYVLSIGVSHFQDRFWPTLKWPAMDAKSFAQSLGVNSGTQVNSQLSQVKVRTLINEQATLDNLKAEIQELRRNLSPSDQLLIYFSTHGTLAPGTQEQWEKVLVLYNTQQNLDFALRHNELYELLQPIAARKKLVIFASCHSGVGKSKWPSHIERLLAARKGQSPEFEDVSESLMVFSAAAKNETAQEDDSLKGDIYTHFFIEGLKLGDRNQDGAITAIEAHDFAKSKTFQFSGGKQRPTALLGMIGEGDMTLVGQKTNKGLPLLEGYNIKYQGLALRTNKGGREILPSAVSLQEGINRVEVFVPSSQKPFSIFEVEAVQGESISLDKLFAKKPYFFETNLAASWWARTPLQTLRSSNADSYLHLGVGMRVMEWEAGVFFKKYGQKKVVYRPGLEVASNQSSLGMSLWAPLRFTGFLQKHQPFIGLNAAYLTQDLVFRDLESSDQLSFRSNGWQYGLAGRLSLTESGEFQVNKIIIYLDLATHFGQLNYSELGPVNLQNTSMGLTLQINFGGKVQRMAGG